MVGANGTTCFNTNSQGLVPIHALKNVILCDIQDMGGAAVVLGLAHVVMSQNLPVQLRVLIPAVENSVSSNSYRPTDVIITRSGISVEVTRIIISVSTVQWLNVMNKTYKNYGNVSWQTIL